MMRWCALVAAAGLGVFSQGALGQGGVGLDGASGGGRGLGVGGNFGLLGDVGLGGGLEPLLWVKPKAGAGVGSSLLENVVRFGALDIAWLRGAEMARRDGGSIAMFAVPSRVWLSPWNAGDVVVENQRVTWTLEIDGANARSINLGMVWDVPLGAELVLLDGAGVVRGGPYTGADVRAHGELWTPPVDGSSLTVVLRSDVGDWDAVMDGFAITNVNLGFRVIGESLGGNRLRSASCHVDVACTQGDAWRSQISSVATYTLNGVAACSGALLNNTSLDGTPYFMTARHCGSQGNPASVVVFWNYENSTCRTPGSAASGAAGDGSLLQNQSGAVLRMTHAGSDWTLLELDAVPDPTWGVDYAGWDRRAILPTSGVGIHHPDFQEKRISVENNSFGTATVSVSGTNVPMWLVQFDEGGISTGSSGSPLFNQVGRVVGSTTGVDTLTACFPQQSVYGRMDAAWNGGGTAATRLSDWLDPGATGATVLDALVVDPFVCLPDVTTTNTNPGDLGYGVPDGAVNGADLSYFVERWLAGDVANADVTTTNTNPGNAGYGVGDGAVNGADLSFFVEAWLVGCV